MISDLATLEGNVRPTAVFDNHQVDARLKTLVDRINENTPFQLSLEVLFSLQPVVTKEEHPLVQLGLAAANANYPRGKRRLGLYPPPPGLAGRHFGGRPVGLRPPSR